MAVDKADKTEKRSSGRPLQKKDRAVEVANTFEWLITAFILAFVFRAFVMEAFRIPTGSMADTLKGAHFRLACPQCGYKYEYGFVPREYGMLEDTVPSSDAPLPITRCPSCGRYPARLRCRRCGQAYDSRSLVRDNGFRRNHNEIDEGAVLPSHCPRCSGEMLSDEAMPVANGDRILVLKCVYQFFEPKRWDVVVFKNPPEPTVNYIKRLIGRPGEKVQIIDGDVYINDQIARKPPKVQNELWMPVYNNDYQPVRPEKGAFKSGAWRQPFRNVGDSQWIVMDNDNPIQFRLDSPTEEQADQIHTLVYDTTVGNSFRTTYAYNDVAYYGNMPYCSDLMVRFDCLAASSRGCIGIALSKYETTYRAKIDFSSGVLVVTRQEEGGEPVKLAETPIERPATDEQAFVTFAYVDRLLVFEYDGTKWTHDLGRNLNDVGLVRRDIEPRVEIFGSGSLTLSHVAIFRDTHYTELRYGNSGEPGRATKEAFLLEKDQFFVLGDNSPNSEDCRWWDRPGLANEGVPEYPEGIVPRDYLVGKALFVYWPSGFKPFAAFPFGIIPNVGRMRFIYGGSNGQP
ncbi:MAG: signal peptidase I [Planctomycetes bacterium RBG_16_55_9]|nr:MAG: signal peptidase I [Planctomycetes bacterium RBG_16_55_9]